MKILCAFGKHQYGQVALGEGIEYTAFVPALRRLGHQVSHFESWDRSVYPNYAELNKALLDRVQRERPDVLLTVQRDCEIWNETLDAIRHHGTVAVAWTTDDSWKYREVSRFIGKHYDAIATTYDYVVPKYRRDGIESVFLTQWAANVDWLQEPLPANACRYSVSFVGKAFPHRRKAVVALGRRGISVECFGEGWPTGPIAAEQIPVVMRSSLVSLNFADGFKGTGRPQIKARTFEVPGAGGLLLTDYAAGLEDLFEIGKEVLTYSGIDNLHAQIRRMIENPVERDVIARAGYLRTARDHTYDKRLAALLEFALEAKRRRAVPSSSLDFDEALECHRPSAALTRLKSFLESGCALVWGAERGRRAARRAVFELSWRLFGAQTFTAAGLPGRMFPEI